MGDMRDWRRAIDEMFNDEFDSSAANRPADGEYELCPVCNSEDEDCEYCKGEGLIDITGEYEIPDFSKMTEGSTLDRFYQDDTLYDTVAPLIDYLELDVNENLYIYETFGAFDVDLETIEHRGNNVYYDGVEDVYFALTANHKYLISTEMVDGLSLDKDMRYVGRTTVGMLTPSSMVSERNDHAKIKLTPKDLSDPDDDGMIERPESAKSVESNLKATAKKYDVEFVKDFAKYTKKNSVKEGLEDELARMLRLAGMMVKPEAYNLPSDECCDEEPNEEGEESVFTNTSDFVDEIRGEPPQDHESFDNPFGDESVLANEAVGDLDKLSQALPAAAEKSGLNFLGRKAGEKLRQLKYDLERGAEQDDSSKGQKYMLRHEDLDMFADDILNAYKKEHGNAPNLRSEKEYKRELTQKWIPQILKSKKYSKFIKPDKKQIDELAKIMMQKASKVKEDINMSNDKFDWDSVLEQENKWRRLENRDLAEDEVEEDFLADPSDVKHDPEADEVEEEKGPGKVLVVVNNEEVYYVLDEYFEGKLEFGHGKDDVFVHAPEDLVQEVLDINGFTNGRDYTFDTPMDEDLQNGYNDRRTHDKDDYFPTGAVSNTSKTHGPEAAKHGGNPMATRMRTNEGADLYEKLKQEYRRHRLK